MCLYHSNLALRRFLKKKRQNKYAVCYKLLYDAYNDSKKLESPIMEKAWNKGWVKSDSKARCICTTDDKTIGRGIHVFQSISAAIAYREKNHSWRVKGSKIYRVHCLLKDLIAVSDTQAVFKKVKLTSEKSCV